MARTHDDITGQKFGRWTVLYEAEPVRDKRGHLIRVWHCICDCGTEDDVYYHSLKSGHSQSCGCLQRERAVAAMVKARKEENIFEPQEDYCIVKDNSGNEFYIDNEDIEKVKEHYWYVDRQSHYVHTHIRNSGTNQDYKMSLNVFLTGEKYADHIDHNPLNNRRNNLRVGNPDVASNQSHNSINHRLGRNNTSGYKGVTFDRTYNRWLANIGVNNKTICLGGFKNKEDAIQARLEAEKKYFPGWSYDASKDKSLNKEGE